MRHRLGIVGSWEKGPKGIDISLEKYLSTGMVEVYCPWPGYLFPSKSEGMRVFLEKGKYSWTGIIVSARVGALSDFFTSKEFLKSVEKNPVCVYLVKLDRDTPFDENIIGVRVELINEKKL